MAVPLRPSIPGDDNNKDTNKDIKKVVPEAPSIGVPPIKKPVRPEIPSLSETSDSNSSDTAPRSFRGANMDAIEEAEEKEVQERLKKLSKIAPTRAQNTSLFHSELTSQDLLVNNWARYEHLMPKVIEVKTWLTELLAAEERTAEIAQARHERGTKYDEMYALIESLLTRYFVKERVVSGIDAKILMAMVANEVLGLGPIEPLWRDNRITEIMVNGPYKIRVEMGGKLHDVPGARFRDPEQLLDVCQQILAPINRSIDVAHPLQDGSLVDGSRVNIVHPTVGNQGPYLTIRKFPETAFTLEDLLSFKSMNEEMAEELGNYIGAGMSTVIIGGTGSGKTSMLNALSGCIPPGERVLVIEDTSELRLHSERDVLYLQARPAQQEGSGEVSIRDLVKNALRMRPDRIVVGEVRDFAAYDMLQAMNTGHDGSMTTVHANDAYSGIERLVNLLSEGGDAVDSNRVLSLISSGVDLFVTIQHYEDGSRRCSGIYEIPNRVTVSEAGKSSLEPVPLWEFVQTGLDENDRVIGNWERREPLSDSMDRKHRLGHRTHYSLEEILQMSKTAGNSAADN